jgi:hypothetical protein
MAKRKTRFKPGVSGNETAKWKPGQSGNPEGKSKQRMQFQEDFNDALLSQGGPEEAAPLLWMAARNQEPWAHPRALPPLRSSDTILSFDPRGRK